MFPAKTKILIIDDAVSIRSLMIELLQKMGFTRIIEAENGQEGLTQLQTGAKEGSLAELIFLDWAMPGMDGIAFLQEIKKEPKYQNIPVLMVTAEAESRSIEALTAGASDYIVKPFHHQTLQDVLERVWQRQQNVSNQPISSQGKMPS